jgi:hypothetical protein
MKATKTTGSVIPETANEQEADCLLCGQSLETEQVRRRYEQNIGSYERLLRDQLEEDIREQVRLAEEQRLAMQATETEDQLRKTFSWATSARTLPFERSTHSSILARYGSVSRSRRTGSSRSPAPARSVTYRPTVWCDTPASEAAERNDPVRS